MDGLRISIIQTDIVWEDKQENLRRIREKLEKLGGATEIAVLPETFSTGFTMNAPAMAENDDGETLQKLRQWAREFRLAIAGSHIAFEEHSGKKLFFNRAFFITPEGECFHYDKRHLFRMGGEAEIFTPGLTRPIVRYRGWNILLLVCYDLRFPVWSRNVDNGYDLLIYVANWPASRRKVWDVLLQARALENMSYVCGVNRIGADGNGLWHSGGSVLFSPKGECLYQAADDEEACHTTTIGLAPLQKFREKFPAWEDADTFNLTI